MTTLNDNDWSTLWRAESLQRRFEAGMFPTGAGQHRHFAKLERLGLFVFDGWGRDIDGERPNDVPVYRLTPFALVVLKQREECCRAYGGSQLGAARTETA